MVEDIGSRERCWRGGCRGRLRYGKEDEWRGGDGMVVRIRFLRKIKREGEGDEDRGGGDGELGAWVAGSVRRSLWWLVQWLLWLAEVETREG